MTVTLSVRLPENLADELEEIASLLDRPKTYVVRKALKEYLDEYADYLVALERLRDKDDEVITAEEMRERLGL